MGKRATKSQKEQRIAQLVRLIANGAMTSDMVEFMRREAGVSKSMAHRYIAQAREVVIADVDMDRKVVVAEMIATCKTLIKKNMHNGQHHIVLGAMNRMAALCGLDAK